MRSSSLPRLFFTLLTVGLFGFASCVPAAHAAVADRINAQLSDASRTAIPGSVHPKVAPANDLGPTPGDTRLVGMTIRFNMTPTQQAALDQLLVDLQDPSSPQFHQWLTPAQFAAQFGLSAADIAKVTAWLTSQGFTITGVAQGGTFIAFDGTVAQAQAAFQTSIHNLSLNGEAHYANVTPATVPIAFAGVTLGITGLHNFRAKPRVRTGVAKPQFTSSISGTHYLAPGDIYTIYDINPLLTTSITGTGMTIAVTGQVDINTGDVVAFRTASGLSTANLPTTVHEGGDPGGAQTCNDCFPNASDLAESSIDVEWSGATAPAASILFVNGPDVFLNAMTAAIDFDLAPIVTTSYGECEAGWGSTELNIMNQIFKQGNAQGQTILAAAGDEGATDCDGGTSAMEGLAVDFPGSSPYVTSMGGTSFNEGSATGTTQYWNGNSSSTTSNAGSAFSYIPETIWNDNNISSFAGGGGGASAFFTKPAWQLGTGVPADDSRDVPDLSLSASNSHDTFLYCIDVAAGDSCTSGFRIASSGDLTVAGGTSFDSQIFGGMLALVEQKIGSTHGVGNANPVIYALANNIAYYTAGQTVLTLSTVVFNDVTTGNNEMPCTAGTPNCPTGAPIGFSTGLGYDLASGWGSVNVYNLASDWNLVTPLGLGALGPNLSATALTASASSVAAATAVTLTATVTGMTIANANPLNTTTGPTPIGSVQFFDNGVAEGSPVALNASGVATYQLATSCSSLGQQLLTAAYLGSATYQGSKGPALPSGGADESGGAVISSNGSVEVTPLELQVTTGACPAFTLPQPFTVSIASGGTPVASITLTSTNGFAGAVTLSASATETTSFAPGFFFNLNPVTLTASGSSSSATATLTLTGIVADLHTPSAPGKVDPGTMLARQSPPPKPPAKGTWYAVGSGVMISSLLLVVLPRRRRLSGLLLVAFAIALVGGITGCGGSSQTGPPASSTNPYAGIYTVTVVATSNTTNQVTSTTVTFDIQ